MSAVTPIRNHLRRPDLERLKAAAEAIGEQLAYIRLRELGEIHCLAPDIPETELVAALERAGLAVSSVDGVQIIHRLPRGAA